METMELKEKGPDYGASTPELLGVLDLNTSSLRTPQCCLFEEVVLCDLASAGYDAEWQTLSAKAFGFPHLRKRCFIVAYSMQGRQFDCNRYFPNLEKLLQRETPKEITVPVPPAWDFSKGDSGYIREDNGVLRKLYRRRIAACGDAVIPTITEYLFRALVEFDKAK